MIAPKNPIFLKNSTDPTNGKLVKEIRLLKKMKPTAREQDRFKWDMIWQYYRDRGQGRKSVEQVYKENKGRKIKIIYFGDPVIHEIDIPIQKGVLVNEPIDTNNNETQE